MSVKAGNKALLKREIKEFFILRPQTRHWSIPILAAISIGTPLFIGLWLNKLNSALTISFAALVILYTPVKSNLINRMGKLLTCSFGFLMSYTIGLLFSFNPIVSALVLGILSGIIHYLTLWLKLSPPGNFFFIMLAAMGSGMPFNPDLIPEHVGLIAIGTMTACIFALIYSWFIPSNNLLQNQYDILAIAKNKNFTDHVEAFIVGLFIFIAMLAGHLFGLEKPYWVPVSCIAVMQGVTIQHIWRRGFYRVTGTFIGMTLCWIILSLVNTPLSLCIIIIILQYIVEVFVTRNYALAVLFITPMAILLIEAGSPIAQNPTTLISIRMLDVLIGSFIGAIGGWFVHNEKIRYKATRRLRIARLLLEKKKF